MIPTQARRIVTVKDPVLASRLYAMSIYPGKSLRVIRKAAFGGAYYLEMEEICFVLREEEYDQIQFED